MWAAHENFCQSLWHFVCLPCLNACCGFPASIERSLSLFQRSLLYDCWTLIAVLLVVVVKPRKAPFSNIYPSGHRKHFLILKAYHQSTKWALKCNIPLNVFCSILRKYVLLHCMIKPLPCKYIQDKVGSCSNNLKLQRSFTEKMVGITHVVLQIVSGFCLS